MSEWFPQLQETIIPEEFWKEISVFTRYVIPVSGGIDSTIIVHEFHNRGIQVELLWNNTRMSMPTARRTLSWIFRITGYPFYITYPDHDQKMILQKTRKIVEKIVTGEWGRKYKRNDLPCCYYVKKAPTKKWYKENTDQETLVINGIAGYEGEQRQTRCGTLRKNNTFLRYHRTFKVWMAYPLRDYTSPNFDGPFLEAYIRTTPYSETRHSGCFTCPIPAMFEHLMIEKDQERLERSKKVWLPKGMTQNDA